MKRYLSSSAFILSIIFFSTISCYSQGLAVNTDGSTADPSAMLDVKATDKGMLVPRVASTANITSPVTGLLIYQTTAPAGFYYYDGDTWLLLQNTSSGTDAGTLTGTTLSGTVTASSLTSVGTLSNLTVTNPIAGSTTGNELPLTFTLPMVRNTNSISLPAANTTADGYLSSIDWNTFNNKQPAITLTTTGTNGAATLTGTTLNIPQYSGGGSPTGSAGGSLSGTYPNPTIATSAVTTNEILDGTITNADITAAAGIPYSKLTLTNSIQNIDIVANAITTSKVANGTVTTSKMADSAISSLKLLTYSVYPRHINVTGASAGQAMIFNGSQVVWATPSGAFPAVITDATALTSITTSSTYQQMTSITLPSTGRYLISAFVNITTHQTDDEYHARITQGGTILTGSSEYYAADAMLSFNTVVNITAGNIGTPVLVQCNNGGMSSGTAVGSYSVVKLSN